MSNTNLTTINYRFRNAQIFKEDTHLNPYYLFVGDHINHVNSELQELSSDLNDTLVYPYRNMIFGKKISNADVSFVIKKRLYTTDVVYDMYDDQDEELETSNFYVEVNEGSYYHFWKCLDNNNGANSNIQPSFAAGSNSELYQTSDGYRWKYMTSISTALYSKFVTSTYIPILSNTSVSNTSISGAIDTVKILNQGAHYNNYLDGTFHGSDLRLEGNTLLYLISNNLSISTNGYYTGCLLYLSGGTGEGQYQTILNYVSNSTGNIIEIDEEFSVPPLNGTTFQIRPTVTIYPIGEEPTLNCVARALVNSLNSNSVYRIEILNRGGGYSESKANVIANSIIGISNTTELRVIQSPFGGHGFNQYEELFCKDVEISVPLTNSISTLVPATNQYQQIGIIFDPLFANVNIRVINPSASFSTGENIFQYTKTFLNANVTANTSNTLLKCNTANFIYQCQINDYLLLTNQDATLNELLQVNSIVNATAITINAIPSFACSECIIYKANLGANAVCTSVETSNSIFVTNCSGKFITSLSIIGDVSGATGILSQTIRNDIPKSFNTFIQLDKYYVTVLSGTFSQNELVMQGSNTAYLFSVNDSSLFVTNYSGGNFNTSGLLVGNTSGAVAQINNQFLKELIPGSGDVMYVENINPVTRQNSQTEVHQLIMQF